MVERASGELREIDFCDGIKLVTNPERLVIGNIADFDHVLGRRHVVLFGPHPDDVELSMGVTASMLAAVCPDIRIVSATAGPEGVLDKYAEVFGKGLIGTDKEIKAQIRTNEGQQAAKVLGANYQGLGIVIRERGESGDGKRHVLGYSRVFEEIGNIDRSRINMLIAKNRNAVWFLPYPFKSQPHHGVHEKVGLEILRALVSLRGNRDVWFYETRERRQRFYRDGVAPNVVVAFGKDFMDFKLRLVANFDSQVSRDPKYYLEVTHKRDARNARIEGNGQYAERFVRGRLVAPRGYKFDGWHD